MNKTLRLSILLLLLGTTAAGYFLWRGQQEETASPSPRPVVMAKPAVAAKPVSPVKQALRRSDFTELDTLFARIEAAAASDGDAERTLHRMLDELSDEDIKQLDSWAAEGGHYSHLALARAHRIRSYLVRGDTYINKIDPVRLARFREQSRAAYVHAEQAAKIHSDCGVAYGLMIDALVGISDRREIDAVFKHSQESAPQWNSPFMSYLYALHPNWYGKQDERKQFIDRFVRSHPEHRANGYMQANEYVRLASLALDEQKYGEAMILADLALEKDPGNTYAWENKGRAFQGVQRAPDALQAFDKSITLNPYNFMAYRHRGQLRLIMGRADGQDDLARAGTLGDTWALKQALWNWITGNTAGVAKDMSRIPGLCEQASQSGMPDGVFCIATMHYFGYGIPQDMKKGFEYMRSAADIGVPDAMSDVGKIYWQGNAAAGVPPNKEQAVRYWIRAAAIGNDRALVEINQIKKDPELLTLVEKIRSEKK